MRLTWLSHDIYIPQLEGLWEVDTSVIDRRKRTFSFSLWYLSFRLPAAAKTDLTARMLTGKLWGGGGGVWEGEGEGEGGGRGRVRGKGRGRDAIQFIQAVQINPDL